MKRRIVLFFTIIIVGFLFALFFRNVSHTPIVQMKTLILAQRLIPFTYVNPAEKIVRYIDNADQLFTLSDHVAQRDHELAIESAFRAENGMTLMVAQLRLLQDTSLVSHKRISGAFTKQYSLLRDMTLPDIPEKQQLETIKSFAQRNEKTANKIYYSHLPPGVPVQL